MYKHFFFILVCEMEATGLILKKNGRRYRDHKWVKRFIRFIYSCTDLKICRFCISVKLSSQKVGLQFFF